MLLAKSDKIFVEEGGGMTNKLVSEEKARRGRNGAVFWVNYLIYKDIFSPFQVNKATMGHLGMLKAKLAKLKRELITPSSGGGGKGEGFDVAKTGDARIG